MPTCGMVFEDLSPSRRDVNIRLDLRACCTCISLSVGDSIGVLTTGVELYNNIYNL